MAEKITGLACPNCQGRVEIPPQGRTAVRPYSGLRVERNG